MLYVYIYIYSYNYDKMSGDDSCVRECVNHFEFHKEITSKNGFIKNLKKYAKLNVFNSFSYTPVAFLLNLDEKNCNLSG